VGFPIIIPMSAYCRVSEGLVGGGSQVMSFYTHVLLLYNYHVGILIYIIFQSFLAENEKCLKRRVRFFLFDSRKRYRYIICIIFETGIIDT